MICFFFKHSVTSEKDKIIISQEKVLTNAPKHFTLVPWRKLHMWILFAFGSALFAGRLPSWRNAVSKIPIPMQLRRSVPLLYLFFMDHGISGQGTTRHRKCFCQNLDISDPVRTATGASWLCYFRALQIGDVDKVVPVDKSSAILSILLAFLFLHESISPLKLLCVVLIGAGTYLMITKRKPLLRIPGKRLELVLLRAWLCRLCQPDFYSGKSRH